MRAWAFIATLMLTSSAHAQHCYSVWKYPQPQHCGSAMRVAVARVPVREEAPLPLPRPVELREQPDIPTIPAFVAPTLNSPPNEWNDLILRAMGIDELKRKLANERQ
jgi:hypothetical protein